MNDDIAQPKPESWQEIARETRKQLCDWIFSMAGHRFGHPKSVASIEGFILAAIERSHATQPQPSKASLWCSCNDPEHQHRTHEHDQPPATATDDKQEWWVEKDVDGYWHIGSGNRGFADLGKGTEAEATAKAIKDAHNAELAAERQCREQAEEDIADAIDYLDGNMAVLELHDGELCEKLISAVSAKFGHAPDELPKLRHQLLSALAAIEKHNKSLEGSAAERHIDPINVDLSALREHDDEVRKPLVDALKAIPAMLDTMPVRTGAHNIRKHISDALAKVKP